MTENPRTTNLLIVSRDPAVLRALDPLEASSNWHLETAANGWEAMERMQSGTACDAMVLDIPLQDGEPMHFLRWLRCFRPDFPVVLLCSPEDAGRVKEATGLDGEDMVYKPLAPASIDRAIRGRISAFGSGAVASDSSNISSAIANKNIEQLGDDTCFVSASLMMQKLRAQAALLAKTDVPVLIVGESGAGKYAVASLIHKLSVRSGFKLVRVSCAAMPEAELAAQLFGDDSDSAAPQTLGKFAAGEQGTILLEEIAEMPAGVQTRLLQALQSDLHGDELRASAGHEGMPARVRILATSSTNLERALSEKQLREDLYHRLSAFTLQVPPLRQRKDEMATLLRYFMHNLARHYRLPVRGFSAGMVAACQRYAWPGNLNELEAFVKRYLVTGAPDSILGEDCSEPAVSVHVASVNMTKVNIAAADTRTASRPVKAEAALLEENGAKPAKCRPESLKSLVHGVKCEAERNAIAAALLRTGWNRKAAARMLKVSYRTMLYKIERYKMRAPQPYFSPLPAGEFSGYESGYETEYGEGKGNGETRYAKLR